MLDETVRISVKLCLEKAQKCLQAAEILLKSESFADSANRSYYAIFHCITAVLVTVGFSAKTHSGNIAEYRKRFVKTGLFPKSFSDIIKDAFRIRNSSDYDVFFIVAKADVVKQIEDAKIFLTATDNYIQSLM